MGDVRRRTEAVLRFSDLVFLILWRGTVRGFTGLEPRFGARTLLSVNSR